MALQFPDPTIQSSYVYSNKRWLWDGLGWHVDVSSSGGTLAAAAQATLVYQMTAATTVVNTSQADLAGRTFLLSGRAPLPPVAVHLNGVRLAEGLDYTVDYPTSQIVMAGQAAVGDIVHVDVFQPSSALAPGRAEVVSLLDVGTDWGAAGQPGGQIDGVRTVFPLYWRDGAGVILPVRPASVDELAVYMDGVRQRPGVDYVIVSGDLSFIAPPALTSQVWVQWFLSASAARAQTAVDSLTPLTWSADVQDADPLLSTVVAARTGRLYNIRVLFTVRWPAGNASAAGPAQFDLVDVSSGSVLDSRVLEGNPGTDGTVVLEGWHEQSGSPGPVQFKVVSSGATQPFNWIGAHISATEL